MEVIDSETKERIEPFVSLIQLAKPDRTLQVYLQRCWAIISLELSFLGWEEIFKIFKNKDYPDAIPPSDVVRKRLDDNAFFNIRGSHLHNIVDINPVLICSEVIEWIIQNIKT